MALFAGLQQVLPLVQQTTFVVVPSTATRIFRTFLCDSIEYGNGNVRPYLLADLTLSYNSPEFPITNVVISMLVVWACGCPVKLALSDCISSPATPDAHAVFPLPTAAAFLHCAPVSQPQIHSHRNHDTAQSGNNVPVR